MCPSNVSSGHWLLQRTEIPVKRLYKKDRAFVTVLNLEDFWKIKMPFYETPREKERIKSQHIISILKPPQRETLQQTH